jgi:anti-anti-sigma regulatory factor
MGTKSHEIQVSRSPDSTEIKLKGHVGEHVLGDLEQAFAKVRGVIKIDFSGVVRINSLGLGILMRLLESSARDHEIQYVACPEVIVDHFQMLDFSRYGYITSFYAEYFCARCKRRDTSLIEVEDLVVSEDESSIEASPRTCDCGGTLRVDEALDFVVEHLRAKRDRHARIA